MHGCSKPPPISIGWSFLAYYYYYYYITTLEQWREGASTMDSATSCGRQATEYHETFFYVSREPCTTKTISWRHGLHHQCSSLVFGGLPPMRCWATGLAVSSVLYCLARWWWENRRWESLLWVGDEGGDAEAVGVPCMPPVPCSHGCFSNCWPLVFPESILEFVGQYLSGSTTHISLCHYRCTYIKTFFREEKKSTWSLLVTNPLSICAHLIRLQQIIIKQSNERKLSIFCLFPLIFWRWQPRKTGV